MKEGEGIEMSTTVLPLRDARSLRFEYLPPIAPSLFCSEDIINKQSSHSEMELAKTSGFSSNEEASSQTCSKLCASSHIIIASFH